MEQVTASFIITIIQLVLKHGVPAAVQIMKDWEIVDPSIEDIEELHDRVPKPETYFAEKAPEIG